MKHPQTFNNIRDCLQIVHASMQTQFLHMEQCVFVCFQTSTSLRLLGIKGHQLNIRGRHGQPIKRMLSQVLRSRPVCNLRQEYK